MKEQLIEWNLNHAIHVQISDIGWQKYYESYKEETQRFQMTPRPLPGIKKSRQSEKGDGWYVFQAWEFCKDFGFLFSLGNSPIKANVFLAKV